MRIYAVVVLLAISVAGQQRPATPPVQMPQTNVKFTADSSLVIADVTVKDPKTGDPIEGLKASDFILLEDGKPQKIQVFEFQKLATTPAPPEVGPTLGSQMELPEDPKTSITIQGPGKIQYHDKRLLVLFFDMSNMAIPDQLRAQEAALKFVETQMTESDLMAIMMYTTTVQVKTDFTANRSQLKDIISAMPIGDMTDLADAADTADDNGEDTGAAFVADETEFNIFNTDRKLAAIEDAVKKLASLPEKKVLVYVTGGISKTGMDNQAQLEASINAAVKANVAIYPIDARGLMADPPGGGASKGATRGAGIVNGAADN
jgi:VWFA-related protein